MADKVNKTAKKENSDNTKVQRVSRKTKAIRIGAALLLIAVVAGIFLPLYNPGSPIKSGKKVMTVNKHDISAQEYEYFLSNDIANYLYYYGASYFADAKNFADLRDYVADELTFYYAFLDWAEKEGHGLTQEQKDEVRVRIETMKLDFENDQKFQEFLESKYVTEDLYYKTECMFECINKYYSFLTESETSPYASSAEALSVNPETFGIYGAKHILFLFDESEERTDEETKALAEEILSRLNAGEDFDTLMNEYSEDTGLENYPEGYTFQEGEMVDEFYQAAKSLEIGKYSSLVESEYGYHIIMRIEPDHKEVVDRIIFNLYETDMDTHVAEAEVSKSKGFDQIAYTDFRISKDYPIESSQESQNEDQES